MIKLLDTIKKVITIKFLLLITAIALFIISVNFTFQSIKKNKIDNIASIEKANEAKINDSISKKKEWEIDSTLNKELNFKEFIFITKYSNGQMYYKFTADLNDINDKRFSNLSKDGFIISFRDKDNFSIYTYNLEFADNMNIVDNGKVISYYWDGNFEMDKNLYHSFKSVKLGWTF